MAEAAKDTGGYVVGGVQAAASLRVAVFDQVPQRAVEVAEYRHRAVVMHSGRAHELDAGVDQAAVIAREVVGLQEQRDAAAGRIADTSRLLVGRRTREQHRR